MDWMYKGVSGLVDKEEYLTGRRIDKTFEIINSEETQTKGDLDAFEPYIPGSVLDNNQTNSSLVTIDLAAKLREDPLYEIRVKQREQRKKLLDNPLKLKKLKTILESTLAEDKDIDRDKHKKHKKKKSRRRSSSNSSRSSDDSDSHHRTHHKRHSKESRSDRRHSGNRSNERHNRNDSNRDRDRNRDKRDFDRRYDSKLKEVKSERRIEKRFDSKQSNDSKPKKLSAEELEQKRKQMIENAVWRECQRKSNVKSYEEQERAENEFNSSSSSAQFIKPLLKSAAESDSLEERIKQKRFRSQRGYDLMDKNFAKK